MENYRVLIDVQLEVYIAATADDPNFDDRLYNRIANGKFAIVKMATDYDLEKVHKE